MKSKDIKGLIWVGRCEFIKSTNGLKYPETLKIHPNKWIELIGREQPERDKNGTLQIFGMTVFLMLFEDENTFTIS